MMSFLWHPSPYGHKSGTKLTLCVYKKRIPVSISVEIYQGIASNCIKPVIVAKVLEIFYFCSIWSIWTKNGNLLNEIKRIKPLELDPIPFLDWLQELENSKFEHHVTNLILYNSNTLLTFTWCRLYLFNTLNSCC